MENTTTNSAASNGDGSAAATQPVNTAAPINTQNNAPDMTTLAQTLISAVENRTQRAEKSAVRSMAEQYGMSESEVAGILAKARDEKAKALPDDVQKRINEATERVNNRLIAAEVKTIGNAMGLVDADIALMLLDKTGIKVDDQGNVTGVKEALDALKTAKPVLFGSTAGAWGQKQGGTAKPTKAEIMAIRDPVERQNKIAQNIDLFKKG